ncbi:MAG: class I SAM-dependent methyltransferase [Promethearchaeota archaeon]
MVGIINKIQIKILLKLHNYLYHIINYLSVRLNNGIHPKHMIIKYHDFFLKNIKKGSKVLDIGCGNGFLTYDIAKKADYVLACDIDKKSIKIARKRFSCNNIKYIVADATKYNFQEKFDFIVLSNVLEHIENRVKFLIKIKHFGKYLLIRVPMLNRSWLTFYKKWFGVEYRLDRSHYIEYTLETFKNELNKAKLSLIDFSIQFGEIWAIVSTQYK